MAQTLNKDGFSKIRANMYYLLHVIHAVLSMCILAMVVLDLYAPSRSSYLLYLLIYLISPLFTETSYLFRRQQNPPGTSDRPAPSGLRWKAFIHQAIGTVAIFWGKTRAISTPYNKIWKPLAVFINLIRVLGVLVFVLAITREERALKDQVEKRQREKVTSSTEGIVLRQTDSAPEHTNAKRILPYVLQFLQFNAAYIRLLILNLKSASDGFLDLYVIPFSLLIFIFRDYYECLIRPPRPPRPPLEDFLEFPMLKAWAFTIQLCGSSFLSWLGYIPRAENDHGAQLATDFGYTMWIVGVGMLALAIASESS